LLSRFPRAQSISSSSQVVEKRIVYRGGLSVEATTLSVEATTLNC
jgi:hypothetical protein